MHAKSIKCTFGLSAFRSVSTAGTSKSCFAGSSTVVRAMAVGTSELCARPVIGGRSSDGVTRPIWSRSFVVWVGFRRLTEISLAVRYKDLKRLRKFV